MSTSDKKILNNYFGMLERLNPQMKLNLIKRLQKSVKTNKSSNSKLNAAFGAWRSKESADELINSIRLSRNTDRHIEQL